MVRLYSKSCNTKEVNEARWILFSRDNKVLKDIPPTKGALKHHALKSVLQSSKWQQSLCKDFDGRGACQCSGQKVENQITPLWIDLLHASIICRELVKCGCKKGCIGQCKCLTSDLKCKELCQYFGQCKNGKSC